MNTVDWSRIKNAFWPGTRKALFLMGLVSPWLGIVAINAAVQETLSNSVWEVVLKREMPLILDRALNRVHRDKDMMDSHQFAGSGLVIGQSDFNAPARFLRPESEDGLGGDPFLWAAWAKFERHRSVPHVDAEVRVQANGLDLQYLLPVYAKRDCTACHTKVREGDLMAIGETTLPFNEITRQWAPRTTRIVFVTLGTPLLLSAYFLAIFYWRRRIAGRIE